MIGGLDAQTMKYGLILIFLAQEIIIMINFANNQNIKARHICGSEFIAAIMGFIFVLNTFNRKKDQKNILIKVLFSLSIISRIVAIILLRIIYSNQTQDNYIKQNVLSCLMRMNLFSLIACCIILWHYLKYGTKLLGQRLSD